MEKIRKALDRARQERQGESVVARPAEPVDNGAGESGGHTRTMRVNDKVLHDQRIMTAFSRSPFTDAYKILRTQILQRFQDNNWKALAVTSPGPGEGKTLTAINLAVALAMEVDYTVLLVEANLQHPNLHNFFGLPPQRGLSDYLLGEAELPELLIRPENLDHTLILPGGRPLPNSAEMLASPRTAKLVEELKNRYPNRIVVFDLPPVLGSADVVAFAPYVDAALLVIEEGKTRETDVEKAVQMLDRTTIIGTVLNKGTNKF